MPGCAAIADQHALQAIPDLAPLKKLKVPELRTLCGTNNVSSVGTKDTLVQRLDALRKSAAEAGTSSKAISVASASTTAARSGAATPVVNPPMTPKQLAGNLRGCLQEVLDTRSCLLVQMGVMQCVAPA